MSRSFKKTPGWTQQSGSSYSKFMKNYANRRVRKFKDEIPNGNWYQKISNSYEINDYSFLYYSKIEVIREVEERYSYPLYKYYMK